MPYLELLSVRSHCGGSPVTACSEGACGEEGPVAVIATFLALLSTNIGHRTKFVYCNMRSQPFSLHSVQRTLTAKNLL